MFLALGLLLCFLTSPVTKGKMFMERTIYCFTFLNGLYMYLLKIILCNDRRIIYFFLPRFQKKKLVPLILCVNYMYQFRFITRSCVNEKLLPLRQVNNTLWFFNSWRLLNYSKKWKNVRGKKTDILYCLLRRKEKTYTSVKFLYHFSINPDI